MFQHRETMTTRNEGNSFKELLLLMGEVDDKRLKEVFNDNMIEITTTLRHLSLYNNFDSNIIDKVIIPSGETARVPHNLRAVPENRLILRQTGNGVISDGSFTENYIELINHGPDEVTLKVAILKG